MSNLSETLPVIDVDVFLSESETSPRVQEECKKVSLAVDLGPSDCPASRLLMP